MASYGMASSSRRAGMGRRVVEGVLEWDEAAGHNSDKSTPSSPSSSTVNNADVNASIWAGRNSPLEEPVRRINFKPFAGGQESCPPKTPKQPMARLPSSPSLMESSPSNSIVTRRHQRRSNTPIDRNRMSLKEQFYACRQNPSLKDPRVKALPLSERPRASVMHDVTGGLFPTPIPIRCSNRDETENLVRSSFIYTEKLQFSSEAWESLQVLDCVCHKCGHLPNNTCFSGPVDGDCVCNHYQRHFRAICLSKHCIFSCESTYNTISPQEDGRILVVSHEDQPLVYECGMMCSCYPNCERSVVLKGPNKSLNLELRWENGFGWGVHTLEPILAYQFLFEYIGNVVTQNETFNYAGNVRNDYMFDNDLLTVDAGRQGNVARWLNHSCVPNCVVMCSYVGHTFVEVSRLIIVTKRLVYAGDPLTIDYGTAWWQAQFKSKNLVCLCRKPNCRYTREKLEQMEADDERKRKELKEQKRIKREDREILAKERIDSAVDEDYCSSRIFIRRRNTNVDGFDDDEEIISIHSDDADYIQASTRRKAHAAGKPAENPKTHAVRKSDIVLKRRGVYNENIRPFYSTRRASDDNILKLRHDRSMRRGKFDLLPAKKRRKTLGTESIQPIDSSLLSPSKSMSKRERLLQLFSSDSENPSPSRRIVENEPACAEPLSTDLLTARQKLAAAAKNALDKVKRRPLDGKNEKRAEKLRARSPMQLRERSRTAEASSITSSSVDAEKVYVGKKTPAVSKKRRINVDDLRTEKNLRKVQKILNYLAESGSESDAVTIESSEKEARHVPPARRMRLQAARTAAVVAATRRAKLRKRVKLENAVFGSISPSPSVNGEVTGVTRTRAPMLTRKAVAEKEVVQLEVTTPPFTSVLPETRQSNTTTRTRDSGQSLTGLIPYRSVSPAARSRAQQTKLTTRDVFGSLSPSLAGSPQKRTPAMTETQGANLNSMLGSSFANGEMPPPSMPSLKSLLAPATVFAAISGSNLNSQLKQPPVFGQRAIKFTLSSTFTKPRDDPTQQSPTSSASSSTPTTTSTNNDDDAVMPIDNTNSKTSVMLPSPSKRVGKQPASVATVVANIVAPLPEPHPPKSAATAKAVTPAAPTATASLAVPPVIMPSVLPTSIATAAGVAANSVAGTFAVSDAAQQKITVAEHLTSLFSAVGALTASKPAAAVAAPPLKTVTPVDNAAVARVNAVPNRSGSKQQAGSSLPVMIEIIDLEEENPVPDVLPAGGAAASIKKPAAVSSAATSPTTASTATDDDDIVVLLNTSPSTPTNAKSGNNKITSSAAALAATTTIAVPKKTVSASTSAAVSTPHAPQPPSGSLPSLQQKSSPAELPMLATALQLLTEKCAYYPAHYINALYAAKFAQVPVRQLFASLMLNSAPVLMPADSSSPSNLSQINQNRYKMLLVCGTQVKTGRFDSPLTVENHVCNELKLQLDATVIVLAESARCHAGAQCRIDQWPDINMTYTLKCYVCHVPHHVACYAGSRKQAGELLAYVKQYWKSSKGNKLELQLTCGACSAAEQAKSVDDAENDVDAELNAGDGVSDGDDTDSLNEVKLIISVKRPVSIKRRRPAAAVAAAPAEAAKPTGSTGSSAARDPL